VRSRAVAGLALLLLAVSPGTLLSQATQQRTACLDSIPASAMRPEVVYLTNDWTFLRRMDDTTIRPSIDLVTQAVAGDIRHTLGASADRVPSGPGVPAWRELREGVAVVWRRDGSFTVRVAPNRIPEVWPGHAGGTLILRALDSLRRADELPPPIGMVGDSVSFALSYDVSEHDSAGSVVPHLLRIGFPVFVTAAPWEEQVHTLRGGRAPRYPAEWRLRNVTAVVQAQFIVDVSGRAVEGSFRDLLPGDASTGGDESRRAYKDFVRAVAEWLPEARFSPARIGGCVVRQLVQQPFTFELTQ